MRPRLTVLVALGCLECGGAGPGKLAPQSPQETLAQFMSAVKANDLERMRTLWGSERGLASGHLKSTDVNQRLAVHAGHGLTYDNVQPIAAIRDIEELNIGHSIVSNAIFVGMEAAVRRMRQLVDEARKP